MKIPEPIDYPCESKLKALYKVYKALYDLKGLFPAAYMNHHMKELYNKSGEWRWRVVGISVNAVKAFEKHNYQGLTGDKGLQRHHFIVERKEAARQMLAKKLIFAEFKKVSFDDDATIIVTKEEHRNNPNEEILAYPLDWKQGYFGGRHYSGRPDYEGEFLKKGKHLDISKRPWTLDKFRKWTRRM